MNELLSENDTPSTQFQSSDLGGGLESFPSPTGEKRNDIEDNKMWAILAYFFMFSIAVLYLKQSSYFAKFHAIQGLLLFIISSAFIILGAIVSLFIGKFIGWLFLVYWILGSVVIFGLFIFGIMNAAGGQIKTLPIVGKLTTLIKF